MPLQRLGVLAAAVAAALTVLITALVAADAVDTEVIPGLPSPGPITPWALPIVSALGNLAAAATVGTLMAAAFLTPGLVPARDRDKAQGTSSSAARRGGRTVGPHGYRWLRAASWAALVWLVLTGAELVYTLSDILAIPVSDLSVRILISFVWDISQGRALLLVMAGAAIIAVASRMVLSVTGAAILTLIGIAATLPPVFTGHSAAAGNHQVAVSSLLWHVVAAVLWAGGLIALLLARHLAPPALTRAVGRYSRLALVCVIVVALSGLLNAFSRLGQGGWSSPYGVEALAKVGALVLLVGLGWWHRRATLPALEQGRRGAFRRLAAVELVLFGATFGLATALSRTPPEVVYAEETSAAAQLGFTPPAAAPTFGSLLSNWLLDPFYLGIAVIAVGLYLAGVIRLWRNGHRWPVGRVVAWCAGWAVVVLATSSGIARYAPIMFSIHMIQHLALMTLAPILLVLGVPITLALRAFRPASEPGMRGPKEWLRLLLHNRVTQVLTSPAVALAFMAVSLFMMYFTGLYELSLRSHAAHLAMLAHLLGAGYLFYWVVIGIDPAPRRAAPPIRLIILLAGMAVHAFFGVILMQSGAPLALDWYRGLGLSWMPDPLADQRTAGGIAWSFGELPSLVVAIALLVQWIRADEREQRRLDRAAERAAKTGDPSQDPLEQYNAYLASLARSESRR